MNKTKSLLIIVAYLTVFLSCSLAFASPAPKGTLAVGMEADTSSMDPLVAWMGYSMNMTRQIYDPLIRFGPDGKFVPCLATSFEKPDDLTLRFHLRKGVKFHNGYPFNAEDVKFTMERILDPANKCRYRSRYTAIESINVLDEYTIEFKTKTPNALLNNHIAMFVRIVSKKWVEENGVEKLRKHAMGTGAFKFVSWSRKDRLVLEANSDHFLNVPKVKKLIFRPIPEMAARMAELEAGGIQIARHVPPFMIQQLEKNPDITTVNFLTNRAIFMTMNTLNVPELKDRRVRQAINYGVDKEAIIEGITKGLGKPLGISVPLHIRGVDQSIEPYPYDPEKARALLAEAGYPDGFDLNIYSPSGRYPMDKEVAQAVGEQLSKIGIRPKVHIMETGKYFKEFIAHTLNGIFVIGHGFDMWDQDAMASFVYSGSTYSHYRNPELEEQVLKMRETMDPDARYKLAHQIQRAIHDEAVHLFLYNQEATYGLSKKVQGFVGRPDEMMDLWTVSLSD